MIVIDRQTQQEQPDQGRELVVWSQPFFVDGNFSWRECHRIEAEQMGDAPDGVVRTRQERSQLGYCPGVIERKHQPAAAPADRPAIRPEKRQPPRNVPSRDR